MDFNNLFFSNLILYLIPDSYTEAGKGGVPALLDLAHVEHQGGHPVTYPQVKYTNEVKVKVNVILNVILERIVIRNYRPRLKIFKVRVWGHNYSLEL